MKTLVLNAGFEPMQLVSWQRALCLVLANKAEIVAAYDHTVRSVSNAFQLPSVVRLVRYVRIVRRFGIVRCNRKNIIIRDRSQCQYCGVYCTAANVTIDHIVPRSRGGRTTWDNVVACCHGCNRRKGDRLPTEVNMKLRRKPQKPSWRDLIGDVDDTVENAWLPYLAAVG